MDTTQRWQLLPDAAEPAVVDTVELRQYELGAFLTFLNERESLVPMYPAAELRLILAANGIPHNSEDLNTALSKREILGMIRDGTPAPAIRAALRQGRVEELARGWKEIVQERQVLRPKRAVTTQENVSAFRAAVQTNFTQEEMFIMGADIDGTPATEPVQTHKGAGLTIIIRPVELLRPVINHQALYMCHTHPGVDALPSREDKETTARFGIQLAHLGIRLIEHYVIAANGGYSCIMQDHLPDLQREITNIINR